jgi:hypothetical protein
MFLTGIVGSRTLGRRLYLICDEIRMAKAAWACSVKVVYSIHQGSPTGNVSNKINITTKKLN